LKGIWVVPVIASILILGTIGSGIYLDDAEAKKSAGTYLTEIGSKKVCGDKLCDEPLSITEKIAAFLESKFMREGGVEQQAIIILDKEKNSLKDQLQRLVQSKHIEEKTGKKILNVFHKILNEVKKKGFDQRVVDRACNETDKIHQQFIKMVKNKRITPSTGQKLIQIVNAFGGNLGCYPAQIDVPIPPSPIISPTMGSPISDCNDVPGPGANFVACNFAFMDLSGVDLSNADLRGAIFVETDLSGANLEGANFGGATLINVDLTGAKLSGADFGGSEINSVNLNGASIQDGNFVGSSIADSTFNNADLTRANFVASDIIDSSFDNANLQDAILAEANLIGTNLNLANTNGVDFG